jgi:hypothetical protein
MFSIWVLPKKNVLDECTDKVANFYRIFSKKCPEYSLYDPNNINAEGVFPYAD